MHGSVGQLARPLGDGDLFSINSMPDYLHECLMRHGDVGHALYGESQKLHEIEVLAAGIYDTGRVTYDDLEIVIHADLWSGGTLWQWPTRTQFDERCGNHGFQDQSVPLWDGAQPTIAKLLNVLRHIEPVSVVLRFIEPRIFGILSPPVEKILEIGPTHKPLDKYLNYVYDLRRLQEQRRFETAAQVDMALWVLQEVIAASDARSDWLEEVVPESDQWIDAFWGDDALRRIRVRNLTRSLFGTMNLSEMAEALLPEDERHLNRVQDQLHVSARIAAVEFELAVMVVARERARLRYDELERLTLYNVVGALELPDDTRQRWRRAVHIRNAAVHDRQVTRNEVQELHDCMREAIGWADGLMRPRNRR